MKLLFFLINLVTGFNIIKGVIRPLPKSFSFCKGDHKEILETTYDIISMFKDNGFDLSIKNNSVNTICSSKNMIGYGKTSLTFFNDSLINTATFINDSVLRYKNTLHNILLHELLHSVGLDHSNKKGMMNYTLYIDTKKNILEDDKKLWLSYDDLQGMYELNKIS